jgi:hypothetical protein
MDSVKEIEKRMEIHTKNLLNTLKRDKMKEYKRRYRLKNADKIKEYDRIYYIKNAGKIREHNREYYIMNSDKLRKRAREYKEKRNLCKSLIDMKNSI